MASAPVAQESGRVGVLHRLRARIAGQLLAEPEGDGEGVLADRFTGVPDGLAVSDARPARRPDGRPGRVAKIPETPETRPKSATPSAGSTSWTWTGSRTAPMPM
ncbi:hypothetical protein ACFTXM_01790 [Streptomyces sp. NPDC056930]|uniref:hypothetical protein n=1 Tax=Streptomyces sp. NPDC056930 TaxID=3345967 RepID=UPI00362BCFD6